MVRLGQLEAGVLKYTNSRVATSDAVVKDLGPAFGFGSFASRLILSVGITCCARTFGLLLIRQLAS